MSYLAKFRASKANRMLQKLARVLQFISAIVSLGFFSTRLKAILLHSHDYNKSDGAVEGILAAASLYSLLATIMQFALRHGAPKMIRWFLVLMDILFVGAFIAVAVLTRPNGGPSGEHKGQCARQRGINGLVPQRVRDQFHCRLPLGTFVLAIISTYVHLSRYHDTFAIFKLHDTNIFYSAFFMPSQPFSMRFATRSTHTAPRTMRISTMRVLVLTVAR